MDRELSEYISGLRSSIVSLWNRLEVESKVQEAFMESCTGPKPEIAEKVCMNILYVRMCLVYMCIYYMFACAYT